MPRQNTWQYTLTDEETAQFKQAIVDLIGEPTPFPVDELLNVSWHAMPANQVGSSMIVNIDPIGGAT